MLQVPNVNFLLAQGEDKDFFEIGEREIISCIAGFLFAFLFPCSFWEPRFPRAM
ncbi:hypothetical protein FHS56_000866 [Thermonema lapsum]|uniref:Uncharacterized protein n=1 Tax=Thermonema lapsum TaxID=28195 RepID=A0A846MPT2_9BACT|nr:hypothetical protein [Thermonema lapsum]